MAKVNKPKSPQLGSINQVIKNKNKEEAGFLSDSLQIAADISQIGFWEWNVEQEKIFIDPTFKKILSLSGLDNSNYIDDWRQIIYPEDVKRVVEQLKEQLLNQSPQFGLEFRITDENGIIRWIFLKGGVVNPRRVVGVCTDISSVMQKYEIVEKKAAEYLTTLQNIPVGILILNNAGEITSANNAFMRLMSYESKDTLLNSNISSILPFKEARLENYFSDLIQKNATFDFESPLIKNLAGKQIYLHCRGLAIPSLERKSFVVLFSDITNHKRLEEQFRQVQKLEAIGELAGGIAHDFNNILTVIQGASDFLLANIKQGHPAFENVTKINNAAERAESLTRQLLAFSRRQMLQPKVLDVNKFIREMESTFQKILGDNTEIEIVLQSEQGNIKADPSQIEQVITNLIINARDAMPGGGRLTIETKDVILDEKYIKKRPMVKPGSYIMFAISDTGVGMDKDHAAHIFEPFFTTKEKGKGTGMGLATVYGIVKQSEGYIWVYSEPDKGTTFKIYLPRIEEYTDLEEQPVISDQSLKGSETILVVDDEEEVRNLVSEMLRFQGYNVLEAPNASNALVIFEKYCTSIDLILTDVVMPQMSGPELMEKLHASYPDVKVLFMSGYTDNIVVKHGLLSEEGNFIQKPFSSALLIQKVRTILDQ